MNTTMSRGSMVYLVGAGPGDPGLITMRAVECLARAEVVVYDRLANPSLLAYAAQAELIDVGKEPDHHPIPQKQITKILLDQARAGKVVVRLKGGDPFVFGRGGEEALALAEAGIPFEVVPGVTSAVAAAAYAGIPVTQRGMACSVAIATGHRADHVEDPACDWRRLAYGADTLVFLMGVANLPRIAAELIDAGRPAGTPAAVIARASGPEQVTVTGTLADIAERAAGIAPPAVIVVGEVVQLREQLNWYERKPLFGLRVLCASAPADAAALATRLSGLGAEPLPCYPSRPSGALSGPLPYDPSRALGVASELASCGPAVRPSTLLERWVLPALEQGRVHAALFAGPEGLRDLSSALDGRGLAATLGGMPVVCSDPATAAAARALGVRVAAVAAASTCDDMVDALLALAPGLRHDVPEPIPS